jgi:hypothetical protein
MNNFVMLRWFVILFSAIAAAGIVNFKGLFAALWIADISGLSFLILAIFTIMTLFVGVLTHRLTTSLPGSYVYEENIRYVKGCWYASELLMAIGMMGTLIGFTIMLGPALAGLDPSNLVLAKAAIFKMAGGMSTAVLTTLVGLITSQLLKLQLINLDVAIDEVDDEKE